MKSRRKQLKTWKKTIQEFNDTRDILLTTKNEREDEISALRQTIKARTDEFDALKKTMNTWEVKIDELKKLTVSQAVQHKSMVKSIDVLRQINENQMVIRETLLEANADPAGEVAVLSHELDARNDVIAVLGERTQIFIDPTRPATANGVHQAAEALASISAGASVTMAEKMATLSLQENHLAASYKPRDDALMKSHNYNH
jgi:hypothetical protein